MKDTRGAKDLTIVEPRGVDAEIEGYAWIPRMLDKARATLAGTNGSFLFGCPVDHTCMARLGISPQLVLELAGRYPQDIDVLRALGEIGIPTAGEAWFDGQAVEDELQDGRGYLRVRPSAPAPGEHDAADSIGAAPNAEQPPAVALAGEVMSVNAGEVTFFLGAHQARTVRAGETVWIPGRVDYRWRNIGSVSAWMTRRRPS
jgi:mannose-6-phosphate isomerase-like protein (cupin superfamily)